MALRPISGALLNADQVRMGVATRVLSQLHGDDVAGLQTADRIFTPAKHHPGLGTVGDDSRTAAARPQKNLTRRRIYPLHRGHELVRDWLTCPGRKGVSAQQRSVTTAACA